MPPTIQARYTSLAEPTACIISAGTRKIPLPMMVPATMAMACQTFNSRNNSGCVAFSAACMGIQGLRGFMSGQADDIADSESCDCSQSHIPGQSDMCAPPDVNVQSQPAEHTSN